MKRSIYTTVLSALLAAGLALGLSLTSASTEAGKPKPTPTISISPRHPITGGPQMSTGPYPTPMSATISAARESTVVYNAGSLTLTVACSNPGETVKVGGDDVYACPGGDVWVYNPRDSQKVQQTSWIGNWFTWRSKKGWKKDDDGGDFRLVNDACC